MYIESIDVFAFKYNHHYRVGGYTHTPNRLPGTNYYFEPQWRHVYSRLTESCLVKIATDTGLIGWGESQAPIVPEVPATLIAKLLGPAIIGLNPEEPEMIYNRLYHLSHVRGHTTSYTIDAMTGLDIALWDLKGKIERQPIYSLLGGKVTDKLPLYVSGLRLPDLSDRVALAKEKVDEGYKGVKLFIGNTVEKTIDECQIIRSIIGPDAFLALDTIGRHDYETAHQIGIELDNLNAVWFESPVDPEDIAGHAKLVKSIKTPIALGEALRTVREFEPWINRNALKIIQPDMVRCGITGGQNIIQLAKKHHLPTFPHIGVCTAIGVAATWQVSATLQGVVQEHQLEMFETANKVLKYPLKTSKGQAVLPEGNGLGVDVNEKFVKENSVEKWKITSKGIIH